ncbi:MAG: 4-hydroxy-tetrahydrodipicolinate reductase [Eubacteriales bacterium]|nr:4-hydroxy-tetrahydrodipicolinate reductase [Eubacteriales bacterium]
MIKVALVGTGKMGELIRQKIEDTDGIYFVGAMDPMNPEADHSLTQLGSFDVIIDFSHPDNLKSIGAYAEKHRVPLVIATTGFSNDQILYIKKLAENMPVVYTANCSLGITVLTKVLEEIGQVLSQDFDIEIIEKHHNKKLDAPSGTAKMLAAAVDPHKEYAQNFGRSGNGKREKEIGIHAVRGGNIVGEHTVIFAGEDEILELTHKAGSKQIFANGALKAARFAVNQPPGLYDMNDVLFG